MDLSVVIYASQGIELLSGNDASTVKFASHKIWSHHTLQINRRILVMQTKSMQVFGNNNDNTNNYVEIMLGMEEEI